MPKLNSGSRTIALPQVTFFIEKINISVQNIVVGETLRNIVKKKSGSKTVVNASEVRKNKHQKVKYQFRKNQFSQLYTEFVFKE